MIPRTERGSITIFTTLSMVLVAITLLTLLEGSRYHEIRRLTQLQSEVAMESVFANYHTYLWEAYRLLGSSQTDMEEQLIGWANKTYKKEAKGINLFLFQVKDVDMESYTLLTDEDGDAYIHAVAGYMKENLGYEAAKAIYEQYEAIKELTESSELDMSDIDDAIDGLEKAKQEEKAVSDASISMSKEMSHNTSKKKEVENPLEDVKTIQKTGILELVVEDTEGLSAAKYDFANGVSGRELYKGKNPQISKVDWFDRVLLQQYLLTYMSSYTNEKEGRQLAYELEYLIGGKESDVENLKVIVMQLLLIREAANLTYLLADAGKIQEATLLATALAGATASPWLVEVVKLGLLTAWAFVESILDVRALLQGKKIAVIKNAKLWTSELKKIGNIAKGYLTAKESETGVSYEGYLGILLLLQKDEDLSLHAMDVQEATIRTAYGDSEFRMDNLFINAKATLQYIYTPAFMSLEELNLDKTWKYETSTTIEYGYE